LQRTGRDKRTLRLLESPGAPEDYTLLSVRGREAFNEPFQFILELETLKPVPAPKTFIGKPCSFLIWPNGGDRRFFNGMISQCVWEQRHESYTQFRLVVVPALHASTLRNDCRIFQGKTVRDMIEAVFSNYPDVDFDISRVTGQLRRMDQAIQFYETDMNFLSRILEREGIFYYFKHDEGASGRFKHKMVMADTTAAYFKCDVDSIPYHTGPHMQRGITRYMAELNSQTGKFRQRDYNYRQPRLNLESENSTISDWADTSSEQYVYPGGFRDRQTGARMVRLAAERAEAKAELTEGDSDVQFLCPGMKISIDHDKMDPIHRNVVICSVDHNARDTTLTNRRELPIYTNRFSALPVAKVYRPPLQANRTVMYGPQSAIVVGPKGEEVHTDEMGRVRVQFHWDRVGKFEENSSFWCRVSQNWAGDRFGVMFIPRIGMEVLVDFIGGDPDRPIVVGCLYNADHKPPYPLPASKTKSGVKTRSSKGGKTRNEICFEDKADEELLYVFAGRDHERQTERDEKVLVKRNRRKDVKGKEDVEIGQSLKINAGTTIEITAAERITLKVGSSSITLTPTGVAIEGLKIDYTSKGSLSIGATGPLAISSQSTAKIEAPITEVKAAALANIQAGLVKIN
jgi:type VI secretion system secreted protein VgrG